MATSIAAAMTMAFPMTAVAAGPAKAPPASGVLMIGSSSVNGAMGRAIGTGLEKHGMSVQRRGVGAAGLARPDFFDWVNEARTIKLAPRTKAAIVYLGGNDAQGIWLHPSERAGKKRRSQWIVWKDPRWTKAYQGRVTAFVDALCKRGVRRVVWLTTVDVGNGWLQKRLRRIRDVQTRGVKKSRCGVVVAATGDLANIARSARTSRPIREKDGVHLTRAGATVLWARLAKRVLELVDSARLASR